MAGAELGITLYVLLGREDVFTLLVRTHVVMATWPHQDSRGDAVRVGQAALLAAYLALVVSAFDAKDISNQAAFLPTLCRAA